MPADLVQEILLKLTEIGTKLDVAIDKGKDHEDRIRAIERRIWLATGAAAAIGGVAGQLGQLLIK